MDRQRGRTDKGFTLLELLVAITIFAIGLLAVVRMQTSAITSNSFAHRLTVATALAAGALENVLALPSGNTLFDTASVNAVHDLDPQTAANTLAVDGLTYSATISVTPNNPAVNVATISITLTPPAGRGQPVAVTGFKRTS